MASFCSDVSMVQATRDPSIEGVNRVDSFKLRSSGGVEYFSVDKDNGIAFTGGLSIPNGSLSMEHGDVGIHNGNLGVTGNAYVVGNAYISKGELRVSSDTITAPANFAVLAQNIPQDATKVSQNTVNLGPDVIIGQKPKYNSQAQTIGYTRTSVNIQSDDRTGTGCVNPGKVVLGFKTNENSTLTTTSNKLETGTDSYIMAMDGDTNGANNGKMTIATGTLCQGAYHNYLVSAGGPQGGIKWLGDLKPYTRKNGNGAYSAANTGTGFAQTYSTTPYSRLCIPMQHFTSTVGNDGPGNSASTDNNIYYTTSTGNSGKPSTVPAPGVDALPPGQIYFDFVFKTLWVYDGAAWYGLQLRSAPGVVITGI